MWENVFSKFFFFFLFSVCCDEIHVERGTELLGGGKIWPGTPNVVERVESGTTTTTTKKKKKKKKKRRRYYPPQLTPLFFSLFSLSPFPSFPLFPPERVEAGVPTQAGPGRRVSLLRPLQQRLPLRLPPDWAA